MPSNPSRTIPFASFDIGTGPHMPDADILETGRIPATNYVSPDFHQREVDHIFKKTWLNIALTHEIAKPGDYVVKEIFGASVIVVRGQDNVIRAFHNVCPHRGTQVVWDTQGTVSRFFCRYHGWVFSTDGALERATDEENCFKNLDKSQVGLSAIACDTYGPWIFITFNPDITLTLREFLGGWADRFDGLPWDEFPLVSRVSRVLDCNWKFGMDANSEGYHIHRLHSRTVASQLATEENKFAHSLGHNYIGPHHEYIVPFNPEYKRPETDTVYTFSLQQAVQLSMSKLDDTAVKSKTGGELAFATHPGINLDNEPLFSQDAFTIFPNSIIQIGRHGWYTAHFYPLDESRCVFYADYGFRRPRSRREQFAQQHSMMFYRDILIEDLLNMDRQHLALKTGGKSHLQTGLQEMLIRHHEACITTLVDTGDANRAGDFGDQSRKLQRAKLIASN